LGFGLEAHIVAVAAGSLVEGLLDVAGCARRFGEAGGCVLAERLAAGKGLLEVCRLGLDSGELRRVPSRRAARLSDSAPSLSRERWIPESRPRAVASCCSRASSRARWA